MTVCDKSVACIKNVDWTKEFSSYHIKWNVGVITDDDLGGYKYSPVFHIPSNKSKKGTVSFELAMWIPDEDLEIADLNVKVDVDFPVPIIHRFALWHEDREILLTDSHLEATSKQHFYDHNRQGVVFDATLVKRDGHLVVHCWLDIPTAIIKKIEESTKDPLSRNIEVPWNISNFLEKSEELYKSVIGENQESTHSDVTLVISKQPIKSGGRFRCHKNILTGASPMFATMFSLNQWKEGEEGSVDIDDIDEDTMKAVLYHIYTGKFKEAEPSDLLNLIYAANKYKLKDLESWAEIQMMATESTDSEWMTCLLFAECAQFHQLRAVCIAMLSTNILILTSDEAKEKISHSKQLQEEISKMIVKRQYSTEHISIGK